MSFSIPEGYYYSDNIIKSFNWIVSLFVSIVNYGWNLIIDPLISLISGKPKVVRILCQPIYNSKMTNEIRDCIMTRGEFSEIKQILQRHKQFDIDYISQLFMKAAKVRFDASYYNDNFRLNVQMCFKQLLGTNVAYEIVDSLIAEKYDRSNEQHETLLLQLWKNLRGDEELKQRNTDQWEEIGFQGKDPATDFRGLGVLSLSNLVYFSTHYGVEAMNCLRQNDVTRGGYPMAITGIQLSSMINQWMSQRLIDHEFYSVIVDDTAMTPEERALYFYQEFFSRVFISFDSFYESKHPESLLQFPIIIKEFEELVKKEIKEGVF